LSAKVDHLLIGGGMANTFLHALDYPVGKSLCEKELMTTALSFRNQHSTSPHGIFGFVVTSAPDAFICV
jgi:3-phosphoglycerate kinase